MEDSLATRPQRRSRPPRRPERQQILLRRGLALAGALILVILVVLGVKGCLNARKHRALSSYAQHVTEIAQGTEQTSKRFFGKLSEPGSLTVTEFVAEVNADRSAMGNYLSRVESLDTPGDMGSAQSAFKLVYQLRDSAMAKIAEEMSTALGDVGAQKATATIARQMQTLMASDVLYNTVVRPEINGVLADNGIQGDDVAENTFLPEGTKWLDEAAVAAALGSVSGATATSAHGIHGLGLITASINGTELLPESTTAVSSEETPEVEVQVQNQGESTENGISVSVTVNGTNTLQGTIGSIPAGETATATIPLTPAPTGTATLEVNVEPVPGERVSENNKGTYTVEFE